MYKLIVSLALAATLPAAIFCDGVESGDLSAWGAACACAEAVITGARGSYTLATGDLGELAIESEIDGAVRPGIVTIYSAGSVEVAGPLAHAGLQAPVKTQDEFRVLSDVYQNDADLAFQMRANDEYAFSLTVYYNTSPLAGLKLGWVLPQGAVMRWSVDNEPATLAGEQVVLGGTAKDMVVRFSGIVLNGASPGTAQLQWAQNTADNNPTAILYGAHGIVTRLGPLASSVQ